MCCRRISIISALPNLAPGQDDPIIVRTLLSSLSRISASAFVMFITFVAELLHSASLLIALGNLNKRLILHRLATSALNGHVICSFSGIFNAGDLHVSIPARIAGAGSTHRGRLLPKIYTAAQA